VWTVGVDRQVSAVYCSPACRGDTLLALLLRVSREWISTRLEERRWRQRRQLVDQWIEEGVHPYPRRADNDEARAEQATFDLVATSINLNGHGTLDLDRCDHLRTGIRRQ